MDVADLLEKDIIFGNLHPRERLTEDDLRQRFSLKRHAARLVLAELERRGSVERRKNIGALVKSYTKGEVVDLYEVRAILETNAARLISFPIPEERIQSLLGTQKEHDLAVETTNFKALHDANLRFHEEIFALCKNKALQDAISEYARRTVAIRFSPFLFPGYLGKARATHYEMIEALRVGDRERLVELCREHLVPARDAYIKAFFGLTGMPDQSRSSDAPAPK